MDSAAPAPDGAGASGHSLPARALDILHAGKSFGEHKALHDVSLSIRAGEVHALLGQNGSGKSTLIKLLSGFHRPDPGMSVVFDGERVDLAATSHRRSWRRHVRFVHQDLALVDTLDSVENLALERGFVTGSFGRVDWKSERGSARVLFERLGLDVDLGVPVGRLDPAGRTMVAIARALQDWEDDHFGVLILDEPTTSLSRVEADRLYAAVSRVAAQGAGILLVTHQLDEVVEVADRFTVLRDGAAIADGVVADVDESTLVKLIVGSTPHRADEGVGVAAGDIRLDAARLSGQGVEAFSVQVRAGEIVGIGGLEGSGRERVANLLAGAATRSGGSVTVDAVALSPGDIRAAVDAGLMLLPADRARRGIVGDLSVGENLLLSRYKDIRSTPVGLWRIQPRRARAEIGGWISRFDVKPIDHAQPARTLSGGNQQKVALARALRLAPRVLVLDEPTQGVDVGARAMIYDQLSAAADAGMAVVMCSSDDTELARECHRVVVMRAGRMAAELAGLQLTDDAIASASLSSAVPSTVSTEMDTK